jgi:uncharacterized RDD family membrane protein YckC
MSERTPLQTVLPCSQCGRTFAHSDMVHIAGNWVCGDCKPAYLSRVMASGAVAASPRGWHYGGFWIRFGARMIDGFVLGVPLLVLFFLFIPRMFNAKGDVSNPFLAAFATFNLTYLLVSLLISGCYEVMLLRYCGGTLGKMACGLKVVRADGRDLGWGVCFGRYFMWNVLSRSIPFLNFVLVLVSSIMAGTDAEKRALHDRVCDTRVVYKQSVA